MDSAKKVQFAEFLAQEAESLLIEHLDAVEEAAAESDPDGDKPVKAKVAVKFEWEAGAPNPKVVTKLTFTTSHKDETERTFDPDQVYMQMEESVGQKTGNN